MDLLNTAVVDITTLVAACHSLKSAPLEGELAAKPKLRGRLRREVKRATLAYVDTLARTKLGAVDVALLAACRRAAEQQMENAVAHQALLRKLMAHGPGSLDGMAAARQDLWRLAHMSIYLRRGVATLHESGAAVDLKAASVQADRLRRRFRKALAAYARASLRTKEPKTQLIMTARKAALAQIGKRGVAEAERLSDIEAGGSPAHTVLRLGVAKALVDLGLDWQSQLPALTAV